VSTRIVGRIRAEGALSASVEVSVRSGARIVSSRRARESVPSRHRVTLRLTPPAAESARSLTLPSDPAAPVAGLDIDAELLAASAVACVATVAPSLTGPGFWGHRCSVRSVPTSRQRSCR
jgi:hypothetical protein